MKFATAIFLSGLFLGMSQAVLGATTGAGVPMPMVEKDLSLEEIGPTYEAANAVLGQDLKGLSSFTVYNATSSAIAIGVRSQSCGSSTVDSYMIPANTGLTKTRVAISRVICVRSLTGSSVSSGKIYLSGE